VSSEVSGRPISKCPFNCRVDQVLKAQPIYKKELDTKCAEGIPYPEIINWLDGVTPGHGIRNYNLSRHLKHITVPVASRMIKNEPPVKFSRSDSSQARMDSRSFAGNQSTEQMSAPVRQSVDKKKATDVAGEVNSAVQRLVEEIENLRRTPSDEWSPGMHKSYADYHEKLLKYLLAYSNLKTTAGETVIDYRSLIAEMGILEDWKQPKKEQEKATTTENIGKSTAEGPESEKSTVKTSKDSAENGEKKQ
jgi:hypothetical protein